MQTLKCPTRGRRHAWSQIWHACRHYITVPHEPFWLKSLKGAGCFRPPPPFRSASGRSEHHPHPGVRHRRPRRERLARRGSSLARRRTRRRSSLRFGTTSTPSSACLSHANRRGRAHGESWCIFLLVAGERYYGCVYIIKNTRFWRIWSRFQWNLKQFLAGEQKFPSKVL